MAKKRRRKKKSSKKSLHVRGAIVRIAGTRRKKARKKAVKKMEHAVEHAVSSVVKDVKKAVKKVKTTLKHPFKPGKGHVYGLKMHIRGRKKYGKPKDHRPNFFD